MEYWQKLNKIHEEKKEEGCKEKFGCTRAELEEKERARYFARTTPEERAERINKLFDDLNSRDNSYNIQDISNWNTAGVSNSLNHREINKDFMNIEDYEVGYDI